MSWIQGQHGLVVYVPEHFELWEVFPPTMKPLFESGSDVHGANLTWLYMDPRVLVTMDRLRERYGTALMNTWGLKESVRKVYGIHQWRGYRPRDCEIGAKLSYHKFGEAADMVFTKVSAQRVREDFSNDPFDFAFEFITAIELYVGWFHFSCQPHDKVNNGILTFNP